MNPLSTHLYPFFGSVIQSFETRRVNFNRINCRNNRQDRRDITQIWGLHPGLTKMANFPSLSCGSALAAVLRAWLFCFPFHWPALARGCDGLDTEPETYSCHRLRDFSHLTYRNEPTNRITFPKANRPFTRDQNMVRNGSFHLRRQSDLRSDCLGPP